MNMNENNPDLDQLLDMLVENPLMELELVMLQELLNLELLVQLQLQ